MGYFQVCLWDRIHEFPDDLGSLPCTSHVATARVTKSAVQLVGQWAVLWLNTDRTVFLAWIYVSVVEYMSLALLYMYTRDIRCAGLSLGL